MSSSDSPPRIGRSVLAVFTGIIVNVIPALAIDGALHMAHVFPPTPQMMTNGLFALATSYRVLLGIAGAYFTARLAPSRPIMHALILGGIGLIMCAAGMITVKDAAAIWYPIVLMVLTIPCSLLGASIAKKRLRG